MIKKDKLLNKKFSEIEFKDYIVLRQKYYDQKIELNRLLKILEKI